MAMKYALTLVYSRFEDQKEGKRTTYVLGREDSKFLGTGLVAMDECLDSEAST